MTTDFEIGTDEYGQRVAWPSSEAGYEYFKAHGADFDLSEQGWELDTDAAAYDKFLDELQAANLSADAAPVEP